MVSWIVILLVGIGIGAIIAYVYFQSKATTMAQATAERMSQRMFDQQKNNLENSFKEKYTAIMEVEKAAVIEETRKDSTKRQRATLKGTISQYLAPFLPGFKYHAADARFLGNPIDYIIFENYTETRDKASDEPINIVFMDVKKGKSATLNPTQKKIKLAVEKKRVRWETLNLTDEKEKIEEELNEGLPEEENKEECAHCGAHIKEGLKFCTKCGKKVE